MDGEEILIKDYINSQTWPKIWDHTNRTLSVTGAFEEFLSILDFSQLKLEGTRTNHTPHICVVPSFPLCLLVYSEIPWENGRNQQTDVVSCGTFERATILDKTALLELIFFLGFLINRFFFSISWSS